MKEATYIAQIDSATHLNKNLHNFHSTTNVERMELFYLVLIN